MKIRADVAELLHAGYGDRTVARQLGLARYHVTQARNALGLPAVGRGPKPAASVEGLFWRRIRPISGGHMEWDGGRNQYGTPTVKHDGRTHTAYQVAFRIKHDRDAQGIVQPTCDQAGCVAPSHMADQPMRAQLDSLYAAIFGEAV